MCDKREFSLLRERCLIVEIYWLDFVLAIGIQKNLPVMWRQRNFCKTSAILLKSLMCDQPHSIFVELNGFLFMPSCNLLKPEAHCIAIIIQKQRMSRTYLMALSRQKSEQSAKLNKVLSVIHHAIPISVLFFQDFNSTCIKMGFMK
jgi:hypothetical protein